MFKKKETLLQNMAFMAIIAAINVLIAALTDLIPFIGIIIILFLPFLSALVTMLCKWRYYPIYALATVLVALILTLTNSMFTIFYLIPSLITGFLFGLSFNDGLDGAVSILITSLAQFGLTYLSIPIINGIYGVDMINQFIKLFQLDSNPYVHSIIPSGIYLLSLIQILFSYIVLRNEINKFNIPQKKILNERLILTLIGLILSISVIPFAFNLESISYVFMFIALFININIFMDIIYTKNKGLIVVNSVFEFIGFLLIFCLYNVVKMPHTLLLINTSNILIFVFALLYNQKRAS